MKISEAKEVIKELYKTKYVTALVSERGVGKTSAYRQCAEELGIGYIDIYAAALEGPDFMGLPDKDIENNRTRYLPPSFLPTMDSVNFGKHLKEGLLIIEEINRVTPDTISVLYPLLLERRINGHQIADGWKIGVTMNPDNLNYTVNTLDDAMIDRFITLNIEPDLDEYISFSQNNGINLTVINFLKKFPEMLLQINKENMSQNRAPTPRGWSKVQEILNIGNLKQHIKQEVISGIVGEFASASLFGYISNISDNFIDGKEILNSYESVKKRIDTIINNHKAEELMIIIRSVITYMENSKSHILSLNNFLNELPQEFRLMFYREISLKRPELIREIFSELDTFNDISDQIIDMVAD